MRFVLGDKPRYYNKEEEYRRFEKNGMNLVNDCEEN